MADPVERLTLNLLATFSEFEREMIVARKELGIRGWTTKTWVRREPASPLRTALRLYVPFREPILRAEDAEDLIT
jgi:hypothetical protein